MYKVRSSSQVDAFLQTLPPASKHKVRLAIGGLASGKGAVISLEENLAGFHRLKVGRYRVIFCYVEPMTIDCIFAEERKLVYEVFSALLRENLDG
jgi:mRNA interferase RelE/StbE